MPLASASSRSAFIRRRFPSPVSASVTASCREAVSSRALSANVHPARAITSSRVTPASTIPTGETWRTSPYSTTPSAVNANVTGITSILLAFTRDLVERRAVGCQAAAPIARAATSHVESINPPTA